MQQHAIAIDGCRISTPRKIKIFSKQVKYIFRDIYIRICHHHHYNIITDQRTRILVQVTIYCRLLIGRDGRLDQSEAYDVHSP